MKIIFLMQAALRRPTMYTMGGSFQEIVAFVEGFGAGAASAPSSNVSKALEDWNNFKLWLTGNSDIHIDDVWTFILQSVKTELEARQFLDERLTEYLEATVE